MPPDLSSDRSAIDDIRAAAERIAGSIERTPAAVSRTPSQITGADVTIKFENMQYTASFEERGALNKLLTLGEAEQGSAFVSPYDDATVMAGKGTGALELLEQAPELHALTGVLAAAGANVVELIQDRLGLSTRLRSAQVDAQIETADRAHHESVVDALTAAGSTVIR